jgi:DNA mismatch endonuclease (patch repair protein)
MVDRISPDRRSEIMARIRSKDSLPEFIVRRLVHGMGYRYRLHGRSLPGKPDLVFPGRRKVIFVHGCWWHRHSCRQGQSVAKTNTAFWAKKMDENIARDRRAIRALKKIGWTVLVVWECQTRQPEHLKHRLRKYLEGV